MKDDHVLSRRSRSCRVSGGEGFKGKNKESCACIYISLFYINRKTSNRAICNYFKNISVSLFFFYHTFIKCLLFCQSYCRFKVPNGQL